METYLIIFLTLLPYQGFGFLEESRTPPETMILCFAPGVLLSIMKTQSTMRLVSAVPYTIPRFLARQLSLARRFGSPEVHNHYNGPFRQDHEPP
jgi:hypothetical protein